MEYINEDVKDDEVDATVLGSHADMKGWIRRRNYLMYKKYYGLIFRENFYLYENPDSTTPFLKFGLSQGKFIETKAKGSGQKNNRIFYDIESKGG